jgi:hypothetical protein
MKGHERDFGVRTAREARSLRVAEASCKSRGNDCSFRATSVAENAP